MFILSFVDDFNNSPSSKIVSSTVEVRNVSNSITKLQDSIKEDITWETDDNVLVGYANNDINEEFISYYIINEVDEI